MIKSKKTTTFERDQPPEGNTNNDLKSFMTKLAEKHDKFCDSCKSIIADALNQNQHSSKIVFKTAKQLLEEQEENGAGFSNKPDFGTRTATDDHTDGDDSLQNDY